MEPEVQKFAAVALVGLLAFFPVFNQVKETSLEALTDADHQAKWKSFFKGWDDIPQDEKLEYWDGRNKPPGADGDFDRDRVDDDAKFRNDQQPPPQPREGDRDGDGVPDDEDADPDDAENDTRREYETMQELLWQYPPDGGPPSGQQEAPAARTLDTGGRSYDNLSVRWSYSGFTGSFTFDLEVGGSNAWHLDEGSGGSGIAIRSQGSGVDDVLQVGTQELTIDYDYAPVGGAPDAFLIEIHGYYKVYADEEA